MKKKLNYYNIFMTAMIVVIAGMLLATGIIAMQKSMNMKIGVNITPSHEIRIVYGGETIFCNTTKDGNQLQVASGYALNANTLTFTQEFLSIGQTFALTIYNYNTSYLQVSVSGTGSSGNTIIIAPYSTTASSEVLNLTISAGVNEAMLKFVVVYSIAYTGNNYTFSGNSTAIEGDPYTATLSVPQYYNLPNTITVTMGGETLTSGYTYTKSSETSATLEIDSISGDVVINCIATADVVDITINVYLDNELNKATTTQIVYNSTSATITITRNYGSGALGSLESITGNHFADYTFSSNSGSGTGYNWSCTTSSTTNAIGQTQTYLSATINITWGTVASAIIINIYGTSS